MFTAISLPRMAWRRATNVAGVALYSSQIYSILCSYPKSGRTWFRFILSTYLAHAFDLGLKPDLHSMFAVMPNLDMDTQRGLPAFAFRSRNPRPPLIPVTHLSYSRLRFHHHPIILMVRDPRDVMVSSYFHATRQKHRFHGGIDEFLKDPEQGIVSLTSYLNGWSRALHYHSHVVVSYEDLARDPYVVAAKVITFLRLETRTDLLASAIKAAEFQNMQHLEQATGIPGHEYDLSDRESLRMRRGKVGGYADYLTEQQINQIGDACDRKLTPEAKTLLERTGFRPVSSSSQAEISER